MSTAAVLIFCVTNLTLPLVVSNFEWRSIAKNLEVPTLTFLYMFLTAGTLIAAHACYLATKPGKSVSRYLRAKVHAKLGLFRTPSATQLWIVGLTGLASLFFIGLSTQSQPGKGGDIVNRLTTMVIPFTYAPFLILLPFLFSNKQYQVRARTFILLGLYFLVIVGAALTRNDRSDFAMPIVVVLFGAILALLMGRLAPNRINAGSMAMLFLAGLLVYPLMSKLAIAMVYARSTYGKEGARRNASATFEAMSGNDQVQQFVSNNIGQRGDWNEVYYDPSNVFLARFANVKFHDNAISYAQVYTPAEREELVDFTWGNFWSFLPTPLFNQLPLNLDKTRYVTASVGDEMFYLASGWGLGGFRAGSFIGHGITVFGLLFFPIYGFLMAIYFAVIDSLTFRIKKVDALGRVAISLPMIAPLAALNIFTLINPYRAGNLSEIPHILLRTLPLQIIFYVAIMFFAVKIESLRSLFKRSTSEQPALS